MKLIGRYDAFVSNDNNTPWKVRRVTARLRRLEDPELGPTMVVDFDGEKHGVFGLPARETIAFAEDVAAAIDAGTGQI